MRTLSDRTVGFWIVLLPVLYALWFPSGALVCVLSCFLAGVQVGVETTFTHLGLIGAGVPRTVPLLKLLLVRLS